MARVALLQAEPRDPATGAIVPQRIAGGGERPYDQLGFKDWRAGLVRPPRYRTGVEFGESGPTGGSLPQTTVLRIAPSDQQLVTTLASLLWIRARLTVHAGDDAAAAPAYPIALKGTVAGVSTTGNALSLTVSDLSTDLAKPVAPDTFAGTGGLEGPIEAAGRVKRRSLGVCFNVEGRVLDKANNIFEFGDPGRPLNAFTTVKDKGRAAVTVAVLPWQGSAAATLAALIAAAAPQGGGVVCPSIACVKWWTQPSGPLTADLQGEIGASYVATPPAIAARIVTSQAPEIAIANLAQAIGWLGTDAGLHIDNGSETAAGALDRLLLPLFVVWIITPAGQLVFRRFSWDGAPVAALKAISVDREAVLSPVRERRLRYQRNHRQHTDAEISAALLDEKLAGIEAGANVTQNHTAASIVGQGSLATKNAVAAGDTVFRVGGGNLLGNSEFERSTAVANLADGFAPYNNDAPGGGMSWDRILGRSGGLAQRFIWTSNASTKGVLLDNSGGVDNTLIWKAGRTYVWSFYAKATGGALGYHMQHAWNVGPAGAAWVENPQLTTEWQRYVLRLTWGATTDPNGYLYVANAPSNDLATLAFDQMQIEEGDMATAYAPRGLPLLPNGVSYELLASTAVRLGLNITRNDGSTVLTDAAAVTALGTAAAFVGQGSLATLSAVGWDSHVSGRPSAITDLIDIGGVYRLNAGYLSKDGTGQVIRDLWPQEAGANVTEGRTSAAIAGQGPGATATASDVLNYVQQSGMVRVSRPEGASLASAAYSDATGAFLIRLPGGNAYEHMLRFTVDIYEYATGAMQTYEVGGYTYAPYNGWVNVSARMIGGSGAARPVFFGRDVIGFWVAIGNNGSVWQYPTIAVRDLQVGYGSPNATTWKAGWSITLDGATNFFGLPGVLLVERPVAGDAVFGLNTVEAWNGAIASLANFKTAVGTAAGFYGQGALATREDVNYDFIRLDTLRRQDYDTDAGSYTANALNQVVQAIAFTPTITNVRASGELYITVTLSVVYGGMPGGNYQDALDSRAVVVITYPDNTTDQRQLAAGTNKFELPSTQSGTHKIEVFARRGAFNVPPAGPENPGTYSRVITIANVEGSLVWKAI